MSDGGVKLSRVGGTDNNNAEFNNHQQISHGFTSNSVGSNTVNDGTDQLCGDNSAVWGVVAKPYHPEPKGWDFNATNPIDGALFPVDGLETGVTDSQPPLTGFPISNPTFRQYQVDTCSRAVLHRSNYTETNNGDIPNSLNSVPVRFPVTPVVSIVPNNNAGKDTLVSSVTPFSSITETRGGKNASGFNSASTIHSIDYGRVRENSTKTYPSRGDETVPSESHQYPPRVLPLNSMCFPSNIAADPNTNTATTTTTIEQSSVGTFLPFDSKTNLNTTSNSEGLRPPLGSPGQRTVVKRGDSSGPSTLDSFELERNGNKISSKGTQVLGVSLDVLGDYHRKRMRMDNAREISPHQRSGDMDEKLEGDDHDHPYREVNNARHTTPVSAGADATSGHASSDDGMWRSTDEIIAAAATSSASETSVAPAVGFPYASSTGQPPTNQTLPVQRYGEGTNNGVSTAEMSVMASAAMGTLCSPNVASIPAPNLAMDFGENNSAVPNVVSNKNSAASKPDGVSRFSAEASPTSRSLDTEATVSTSTVSWVEQESPPSHRMLLPNAPSSASAMQRRPDRLTMRLEKSSAVPASRDSASEGIKNLLPQRRFQALDNRVTAPTPSSAHLTTSSYHGSASSGPDKSPLTAPRGYPPFVKARRSMLPQSQGQSSPAQTQTFGQVQQQQQRQWGPQHQLLMSRGTPPPAMQSWQDQHSHQQHQQQLPYQQSDDASPPYSHSSDDSPLSSPSLSPRMSSQVPPPLYQEGMTHDQHPVAHHGPPRYLNHRDKVEVPAQHIRDVAPSHRPHHLSSQSVGGQHQHHHEPFHPRHHQQQYPASPHHMHAAPSTHHVPQHQRMGGYGHHYPNYDVNTGMGFASPPSSSTGTAMPQHMHARNIPHHGGGGAPSSSASPSNPPASRSPPEILKTLLRKKACLYEPGTSRAIALATWLVGRRLALAHGYFSRQQLQSGVHAAAASKIENGVITRTKVNRCMQIILNSCFHYIIPRPDGSEEKGDAFQGAFAERAVDDGHLLQELPSPWDDVVIDDKLVENALQRSAEKTDDEDEETPSSGRGRQAKKRGFSPPSDVKDGVAGVSGAGSKRAVLLCFNENVRSAEDVFRCHNEFIRDAAHSANLQLTAQDWRSFFSGEDVTNAQGGIFGEGFVPQQQQVDLPTSMQLPSSIFSPEGMGLFKKATPDESSAQSDILGCMTSSELSRFRTTWCSKRYDHDPALCFFAHVEINQGWLRRDPRVCRYTPQMCPHIKGVPLAATTAPGSKFKGGGSSGQSSTKCFFNVCPHGVHCTYAHSKEEIEYHPDQYKKRICDVASVTTPPSGRGSQPSCPLRDICPHFHPHDQQPTHAPQLKQHYPRHANQRRGDSPGRGGKRHVVASAGGGGGAGTDQQPSGAPMLYVSPAPKSDFEASLMLPGLRDIFRRHSSTLYALHCGVPLSSCTYSNFGDDWGLPAIGKSGE